LKQSIVNDKDIEYLISCDPIFAYILNTYGTPPDWNRPQGFVSLCRIILEQQVSLASANAHYQKLNSYLSSFSPQEMIKLSDEEMRACQISRQKATYLRALSESILQGDIDVESLQELTEHQVRDKLIKIKGIGNWTIDVYLMFCLRSKDIFPIGDIALVNTVKELTAAKTSGDILLLAEKWQPYRSLSAYFLWYFYLKKRKRM
jgi:DNA-3-methyladenine glycosylase II